MTEGDCVRVIHAFARFRQKIRQWHRKLTQIAKGTHSFAGKELHRVTASIIISFKTKTMFRAATETVKIASRRIVLSNKKTGAGVGAGPGETKRCEEKKGGGARPRGRAN